MRELLRAMIRGARLANPADPKAALTAIVLKRFNAEATMGLTQISASGNGFTSAWSIPGELDGAAVLNLANAALDWFEANPTKVLVATEFPRDIRRLRASFSRAL